VGHMFDFRPYFKTSLNGKYADYLAVGIISRDRGIIRARRFSSMAK